MITVEEFMTSELCTMSETDSVNDARKVMTERHIRHIPVTDGENRLIGLVTQRDILAVTAPEPVGRENKASETGKGDARLSAVSYTHLTLPTIILPCRSRWSP